jgi:hypothetical protein
VLLVAGTFAAAVTLIAVAGVGTPGPAGAASADFSIVTSPALDPPFNPAISDYVVRCDSPGTPMTTVTTTGSDPVTIAGTAFPGPASVSVPLVAGQGMTVSVGGTSYEIRCLPSDFPGYSSSVTGTPQANGYLVALSPYAVVFDNQGVPVWWDKDSAAFSPIDAKFLSPTTVAYWDGTSQGYELRGLDGSLQGEVGGGSVPLNFHDMQQLPNGDYLAIENETTNCPADPAVCIDLSSWGLSAQSSILDNVIVELNPQNQIVWQWDTAEHVDVAAENVNWRGQYPDVIHMNAIEYDGHGGIIFSARHLDAVYRIDMATGDITWKLGGAPTAESLSVVGDPYVDDGGPLFSGQHYARLQPDGSLTVHDNGTQAGRPPRALQFTIDTSTSTATEVQQVTDARMPASNFQGSAEKLPGGDWVIDWGGGDFTTELNADGVPQLTITYPGNISYRAADVLASISALRQGMDAMVPPAQYTPATSGYWMAASDGGIFAFNAPFFGSMGGQPLDKPIVGLAADPATGGYWEVASDGGVFAFNAPFFGSMGGQPLNKPIVGLVATHDGGGYWEVASDGGIFAFGDATFHGSMGGQPLNAPVVSVASSPDGQGYLEVASDGGIFAFGDAVFAGSMGGQHLNKPIVGLTADLATDGYREVASDGGVFAFNAPFFGSPAATPLVKPVVGAASTSDGQGYSMAATDGGLFNYGDAAFLGSLGAQPLNAPVVAIAASSTT